MSNPAHSPDGHDGHAAAHEGGHGGGDHVPHVLPLGAYFAVWGALVVFTIITVIASRIDFGDGNLIIAMLIATTKAALVGLVFMHLLWDHRFHSMILLSSIIFLGIFIGFTSTDTFRRGLADSIEARRPANISEPLCRGGGCSTRAASFRRRAR